MLLDGGYWIPASGWWPPATGHRPPATGHRPPATGHRPPATGHRPPATGYRIPDTGYRIPDTGYRIPDTGLFTGSMHNLLLKKNFTLPSGQMAKCPTLHRSKPVFRLIDIYPAHKAGFLSRSLVPQITVVVDNPGQAHRVSEPRVDSNGKIKRYRRTFPFGKHTAIHTEAKHKRWRYPESGRTALVTSLQFTSKQSRLRWQLLFRASKLDFAPTLKSWKTAFFQPRRLLHHLNTVTQFFTWENNCRTEQN